MNTKIVKVSNADTNDIVNIILPIQTIEFGENITIDDQPDLKDVQTYYHHTGGGFWAAKINGELVGTIALVKLSRNAGAIKKMFLKKEFRGPEYGIAALLLKTLIDYCIDHGIENLYLGTLDKLKAAIRFYEKNDFIEIEKSSLPSEFPLVKFDNLFYHLKING